MRDFSRWDQTVSTERSNELLWELASWHLAQVTEDAATEREHLRDLVSRGDFLSVCDFRFPYERLAPLDAYHLRQVQAFYNKRADIDVGVDKEAVAFGKFEEAERLCAETNSILRMWSSGKFQFLRDVEQVLHLAQRKIATLLGDGVPALSELHIRFGPGATTQVQKRTASAREKLSQTFACSEDLLPVISYCLEEMPGWLPGEAADKALVPVEIHRGRLSFVPKTLKTDRSIAVEPSLNTMFQAGIGSHLAGLLRRVGVDIRDQTRNQRLAKEGSFTGALATLDLSSASDTVARELVFHLLPVDWALTLDYFRTGEVEYKGRVIKLQKFSSMGNGFTFPLETLIFWALSAASAQAAGCSTQDVSVYGDDIIVPVQAYDLLCRVLRAAGFIPNQDKSFASGPFRESCGKDYVSGIDIRPAYVKGSLSGADAFVLHNFYVRTWQPELASIVKTWLSEDLQIFGPDGYGDGHLLGDWAPKRHKRSRGYAGYTFETFTWKPRKSFRLKPGDRFYPAYSIYVSSSEATEARNPYLSDIHGRNPAGGTLEFDARLRGDRLVYELKYREPSTPHSFDGEGNLGVTLPGKRGYKRIEIYTFCTP